MSRFEKPWDGATKRTKRRGFKSWLARWVTPLGGEKAKSLFPVRAQVKIEPLKTTGKSEIWLSSDTQQSLTYWIDDTQILTTLDLNNLPFDPAVAAMQSCSKEERKKWRK